MSKKLCSSHHISQIRRAHPFSYRLRNLNQRPAETPVDCHGDNVLGVEKVDLKLNSTDSAAALTQRPMTRRHVPDNFMYSDLDLGSDTDEFTKSSNAFKKDIVDHDSVACESRVINKMLVQQPIRMEKLSSPSKFSDEHIEISLKLARFAFDFPVTNELSSPDTKPTDNMSLFTSFLRWVKSRVLPLYPNYTLNFDYSALASNSPARWSNYKSLYDILYLAQRDYIFYESEEAAVIVQENDHEEKVRDSSLATTVGNCIGKMNNLLKHMRNRKISITSKY
jgi:hypothetical protein